MDTPASYFHWGLILVSIPNLMLVALMILMFALALLLPFPGHPVEPGDGEA